MLTMTPTRTMVQLIVMTKRGGFITKTNITTKNRVAPGGLMIHVIPALGKSIIMKTESGKALTQDLFCVTGFKTDYAIRKMFPA